MSLRMLRLFRRDGKHELWRRRNLPAVYRYALAVLPDDGDALDVARATFGIAGLHGGRPSRRRLVDAAHALARARVPDENGIGEAPLEGGECDEAERLLSRKLDGRVARPDRRRLRSHLRRCRRCRARRAAHGAVRRAVRSLGALSAPPDLVADGTRFTSCARRGSLAREAPDVGKRRPVGIVNRRNAMLGWAAWQVGKRVAQRKAKSAVPAVDTESRRPNKPAVAAALAALVGGLVFWRRRRDSGASEGGSSESNE